jgi:SWI/SNF-related matrix-associated actin-dependent regulator 1 of chromatin subfamily A
MLYLEDDQLVFNFPYDSAQVAEIKQIPGARWNRTNRVWTLPVSSLEHARKFAKTYGYETTNEVLTLTLPSHKNDDERVSLDGEFISLAFPYDPVKVRSVKQIPGVTWDGGTMAWKAPLASIEEATKWATIFSIPIDAEVEAKGNESTSELNELYEASRATDAELTVPGLQATMFPYQRAGVAYAMKAKRCFIADAMGLGKTLEGLCSLEMLHAYPAVIVCPPNLVLNWANEYKQFLPHRNVATVTNRKEFPKDYEVVVVGYSNLNAWQKELSGHNGYIFDESQYVKTGTSQRTKAAKKIVRSSPEAPVLMLTGTPITNRPAEYASQLEILGQIDKFGGKWGFYRRFCDAHKDKWGQWHLEGHSHLDELNDRLRSTCYIRRTKEEVLKDLPPVLHDPMVVDGTPLAMKEYKKAESDIVKYLIERAKEIAKELGEPIGSAAVRAKFKAEANQHLVKLSVLRRLAAKAKMAQVEEWIDAHIGEGKKVVVAAHHRDIVDHLAERHGGLKIQGGMKVEEVEAAKHRFQTLSAEEAPVMVLSIQAAKTGHTLTAAQNVLFVELPWTPADVDQTYSRCHRIGQTGSVTVTYMLTNDTVDEEIYSLINDKRRVVDQATEGGDMIVAAESVAIRMISTLLDGLS